MYITEKNSINAARNTKEILRALKKAHIGFSDIMDYRPHTTDFWISYLGSPKNASGVKLHIPVEHNGENYLKFISSLGEAMEKVPEAVSNQGVVAFKIAQHANEGSQLGKNTCIYLGKSLADHPEILSKFCNEFHNAMQKRGVTFMKIPKGSQYNLNTGDVLVEGTDGRIWWSYDGDPRPGYDGIWKKLGRGYKAADKGRSISEEMKAFFKNVKIDSHPAKNLSPLKNNNPILKENNNLISKNKNFINMLSELDSQGKMEMSPLINSKTKELKGYVVSIDLQNHSVAEQQRIIQELKQSGIGENSILNKNGKLMIEGKTFTKATDNFFSTAIAPMPPIYDTPQPYKLRSGFDVLNELYKDKKIGIMSGGDEKFFIDMRHLSLDDQTKVMKDLEYHHVKSHFHGKNSSIVIIDDERRFERHLSWVKRNVVAAKHMFQKFGPQWNNVPQSVIDQLHDFKQNKKISKVRICDAKGVCVGEGYHINMTGYRPEEIEKMRKFLTYKCGGNVRLSQSNPGFLTVRNGKSLDQLYHHLSLKEGVIQSNQTSSVMSLNSALNADQKAPNSENSALKSAEESPAASKAAQEAPVEWKAGEEELQRRAALSASKNSAGEAAESTAKVTEKVKNLNRLLQEGSNAGKAGEGARSAFGAARRLVNTAKAVQNAEEAAKAAKGVGLVQKGLRAFIK